MAVNLASKYSPKMATYFTLASVVDGRVNNDYDWDGVKSIYVYTPVTQALGDYSRTGTARYGTPTEVSDIVQNMAIAKDRSASMVVDKGNLNEQMGVKQSNKVLKAEMDEVVIPEMDKYALNAFCNQAYTITAASGALAVGTVVAALNTGLVSLANNNVQAKDCTIWIRWTDYGLLRMATEFTYLDSIAAKNYTNGVMGLFMGAAVVPVPDTYLQYGASNTQAYFVIAHKSAVIQPKKLQDYFIKKDPPGISGDLIEIRVNYDAFVIGGKAKGVYALVANGGKQANVTVGTPTNGVASLTSTGATYIKYTWDGTDPRYSNSALTAATGGNTVTTGLAAGTYTLKSVAYDDTLYTSDVVTTTSIVIS